MVEITGSKLWEPQDLIDDLQQVIDEEPDVYPNDRVVTLCMARDYLKEFFQNREWISVKDRLPKDGVRVLVARDDGVVRIGISRGYLPSVVSRTHTKAFGITEVTHWMPLPEPPKGDCKMNDLISRSRARHEFSHYFRDNEKIREQCDSLLCMLPAMDAVPVVRCKDCKNHLYDDDIDFLCGHTGMYTRFDDFCSYGERKDDDRIAD